MGWRTVTVSGHSKLSYKNNMMSYKTESHPEELIPLDEINVLIVETTEVMITTMLLNRLIDENVSVIFCDVKRVPNSVLVSLYGRHDSSKQIMRQIAWEEKRKQEVWTKIIAQKIKNQALHLKQREMVEVSDTLFKNLEELKINDETNREACSARLYFSSLFGSKFSREEESDYNNGLDYGYTLVLSMIARDVVCNGCLTQLGLKHCNQFNYFNLVSDIMEPFRVIIDQIVYDNKEKEFKTIRSELFTIFEKTYRYNNQDMLLKNIVEDYVRKVIQCLNGEREEVPVFEYELPRNENDINV